MGFSHCLILTLESQLLNPGLEFPSSPPDICFLLILTSLLLALILSFPCFVPEVFCSGCLFSLLFLVLTLWLILFLSEQGHKCTNSLWLLVHLQEGSDVFPLSGWEGFCSAFRSKTCPLAMFRIPTWSPAWPTLCWMKLVMDLFLKFISYWSIVELQCCVNLLLYSKVTQLYIYIHSFSYFFPLWFIIRYWI